MGFQGGAELSPCLPHLLDKYIKDLTSHLLKKIPGSLIDTHDFISRPTGTLFACSQLFTADVTSLYPNIPWTDGIDASTAFYTENLQTYSYANLNQFYYPFQRQTIFSSD
jgi:hypothetical protein